MYIYIYIHIMRGSAEPSGTFGTMGTKPSARSRTGGPTKLYYTTLYYTILLYYILYYTILYYNIL